MTIRKQLMLVIILMILSAVAINSALSTAFIDSYFKDYVSKQYEDKVENLRRYAENLLLEGYDNKSRVQLELDQYLGDPVTKIVITDARGNIIAFAENRILNMHNSMMMNRMTATEDDVFDLKSGARSIGSLFITRNSAVRSSETVRLFKISILLGAAVSGISVFVISLLATAFISKRISKDLSQTAAFAMSLELDEPYKVSSSKIREIQDVQLTLRSLSNKLKLQKSVRKEKLDQLAHEARTPLTILRSHCEGALDGVVELDKSRLQSCVNEIERLSHFISTLDQVIEYSDNKTVPLITEQFDLVSEISKIMKGLRLTYRTKNIRLEYEGPETLMVKLDPSKVSQALYNLLTNAYKFTSEDGIVRIVLVPDKDTFKLSVIDNGAGIGPEDLPHIFDAYYRSKGALSEQGDGLGLYITRQTLETMNGSINVSSIPGEGSTFTICLPAGL